MAYDKICPLLSQQYPKFYSCFRGIIIHSKTTMQLHTAYTPPWPGHRILKEGRRGLIIKQSWIINKAERRRIDAFELWCEGRLLRVPWTARRSNQSSLKEISPGCSLEGLMLKLKLQHFGHLMQRVDSLEKTLMLGGIGSRRRRGRQRMR